MQTVADVQTEADASSGGDSEGGEGLDAADSSSGNESPTDAAGDVGSDASGEEGDSDDTTDTEPDALDDGNAAKGKTLFYKSAAACFACHDPPSGAIKRVHQKACNPPVA